MRFRNSRRSASPRVRRGLTVEQLEQRRVLASIIVNSVSDAVDFAGSQQIGDLPGGDGDITLREAILAANNTPGADDITFNIPGGGAQTINLTSVLPTITESLSIDGAGQITLDAGGVASDLLTADTVSGLTLTNFAIRNTGGDAAAVNVVDSSSVLIDALDLTDTGFAFNDRGIIATNIDGLTIQDVAAQNKNRAVDVVGGSDATIVNNDFTSAGGVGLRVDGVAANTLPSGVSISGNTYGGFGDAVILENLSNLVISDGTVAGTDVALETGSGASNVRGWSLTLDNVDNTVIDTLDVSDTSGQFVDRGIQSSGSDSLTIQNVLASNKFEAVKIEGGSNLLITDNDFTQSNNVGLVVDGVSGISVHSNQYGNGFGGLQLANMSGLTISDGSVAGSQVVLEPGSGLTTAGKRVLSLVNIDDSLVANLDLSDAGLAYISGDTGLYVERSDDIVIRDIQSNDRSFGIDVFRGSDVQIFDATLSNSNGAPLRIDGVTAGALPGGLNVHSLTVAGTEGVQLRNLSNLLISDGTVPGTNVAFEPSSGLNTITDAALTLTNVDNSVVDGIDVSDGGAPSPDDSGLVVSSSDNLLIQNVNAQNQNRGIDVLSGSNVQLLNNHVQNADLFAMRVGRVTSGLLIDDNQFSGGGDGLILEAMTNLTISADSTVSSGASADVILDAADGIGSVGGVALTLNRVSNSLIESLDLSDPGTAGAGDVGLKATQLSNLQVDLLEVRDKAIGIEFGSIFGVAVTCSAILTNDTGVEFGASSVSSAVMFDNYIGANGLGVSALSTSTTIDAENNFWGASDGPSNLGGSGDSYAGNVDADPFLAGLASCLDIPFPPAMRDQLFVVPENLVNVGAVVANDPNTGDTLTFSLTGSGPDDAQFSITPSGDLSFLAAPDYENPTDVGGTPGDNVYEVEVQVTDGTTPVTASMTVQVDPVNDNAPVFTSPDAVSVEENTANVQTVAATDADLPGQTISYNITGGDDGALFQLVGDQLSFVAAPDFELPTDADGDNTYLVEVTADDGNGLQTPQLITVQVTPVNDNAPIFTSDDVVSVEENTTDVQTVAATDADLPAQTISYDISGGDDQALFQLSGGQLSFVAAPDFEAPSDANGDNTYLVEVTADDGNGLETQQLITVHVTPVNDNAPVFTSPDTVNVEENTTGVQTVAATDADLPAQTVSYDISGGDDGALFQLVGDQLSFVAAPDFELPADANGDNTYLVEVTANDGNGLETSQLITVQVTPVNDNAPIFTSPDTVNVEENTTGVQTVAATDADLPAQTISYDISGGDDGALFQLIGDQLSFAAAPDFELPTDANGDNTYLVEVTASDGNGLETSQLITVHVTPVNDNAPVFTSPDTVNVEENTTGVQTVAATDADLPAQTISYDISGGDDGALFQLIGDQLSFVAAPDFELPADANGDNTYFVEVTASDGNGLETQQLITVHVTPVNDGAPVFISPDLVSVAENTSAVQTVVAIDDDQPPQAITYAITGGDDEALFQLIGDQLSFVAAPDFELPADANSDNTYLVEVTADDSNGLETSQLITVQVTPVNDNAPIFTSSDTVDVAENTTGVQTVAATDADLPAQTISYDITGGDDGALFQLVGDQLSFVAAPDFEAPGDANGDNTYLVEVTADDGNGLETSQLITVQVTPVNDNAPIFTSSDTVDVAENTTGVQTVAATDADLPVQSISYDISGGDDGALFQLVGDQLSFVAAPDFEAPSDANGDNTYLVEVTADDGNGLETPQLITVHVTPVNDNAPIFTSSDSVDVAENTTGVQTVAATDADLPVQSISYDITGGDDGALFQLVGDQLSFVAAPDFEAPSDANGDNTYLVEVTADDGNGLETPQLITVHVTPVNDNAPIFTSSDTVDVAENTTGVQTVAATDADLPGQTISYDITGGDDGALFQLVGDELSFVTAPDFEAPGDANGDNTYLVEVTADDGNGLTTSQLITVHVTPVNDNTPIFTSPDEASAPENTTPVLTLAATDADVPSQSVAFSIVGGPDASQFQITGGNQLSFITPPDYENPQDLGANNVYVLRVQANDGEGLTTVQRVEVTVTPVNDNAPVFVSATEETVVEGDTFVQTVAATDADLPPQTVVYDVVGGADAGLFQLNGDQLSFSNAPAFDTPLDADADNVYEIIVQADDQEGLTTTQTVLVTVEPREDCDDCKDTGVRLVDGVLIIVGTNSDDLVFVNIGRGAHDEEFKEYDHDDERDDDDDDERDDDGEDDDDDDDDNAWRRGQGKKHEKHKKHKGSLIVDVRFGDGEWERYRFNRGKVDQIFVQLCDGDDVAVIGGHYDRHDDDRDHSNSNVAIPSVLLGDEGNDLLKGGSKTDVILGGAGNDILRGRQGDDALSGGSGKDLLVGDNGKDLLIGGEDCDAVFGLNGNDLLIGGSAAQEEDVAALYAALAQWKRHDFHDALAELGDITDDLARDKLIGGRGWDCIVSGRGDFVWY